MFKKYITGLALIISAVTFSQVGIGTETPHPSSDLELGASDKALYLNRVANTSFVNDPQPGMMIYDLSDHCVKVYEGDPAEWSECLGMSNTTPLTPRNVKVGYTNGNFNFAFSHTAFKSQLENTANYGASGTFKGVDGFEFINAQGDVVSSTVTAAELKAEYDMIVTGYANISTIGVNKLKEYVDLGGVLFALLDFGVGSNLNVVFGGTGNVAAGGATYAYARTNTNSINNGVFGNGGGITIRGMQDSANPSVTDLPAGATILGYRNVPNNLTGDTNTDYALAWTTGAQGRAIFVFDEGIFRSNFTTDGGIHYVNGTVIDTPQEVFIHNLMAYALTKVGFSAD